MPLAIAIFRRGHPDIALTLSEGEPEEIVPRMRAGEFDLALLFKFPGLASEFDAGLRTVALVEDPMYLALPAGHPLSAKPSLRLADLHDEDWVQTSEASPCARHVVRLCLTAGFEPKVSFESDDYETVQGLVAAGVGVALVPRLALTHIHPRVVVRELSPKSPVRKVVAATLRGPAVAPAARTMLRILSDVARDYSSSLERRAPGGELVEAS
jgi:DNA-binding transcriptional LysR family regulator